jgi:hypothetical protein
MARLTMRERNVVDAAKAYELIAGEIADSGAAMSASDQHRLAKAARALVSMVRALRADELVERRQRSRSTRETAKRERARRVHDVRGRRAMKGRFGLSVRAAKVLRSQVKNRAATG